MKMTTHKAHKLLFAAVALSALCLLPGCATIAEWFASDPVIREPRGWEPTTSVSVENKTTLPPHLQPLKIGDNIVVSLRAITVALDQPCTVDFAGNIVLQYLGDFYVLHSNPTEAARMIHNAYVDKKIFANPTVQVVVPKPPETPEFYYTDGCIINKGKQQFYEGLTLYKAILSSGGPSPYANDKVILRRSGVTTTYSLKKLKSGKVDDPIVRPDDIIRLGESIW